ncbi:MAG: DUF4159 domain-containing protein [Candidatus Cloacimonadales bacterium]
MKYIIFMLMLFSWQLLPADQLARLHYAGGGDWYNDADAIPNLCEFLNENLQTDFALTEAVVKPDAGSIFNYPFIFATGHGKLSFDQAERQNLREYLRRGGFLYVDDDYGMDQYFRAEIKLLFPEKQLVELPAEHEIFSSYYQFSRGVPKIHEHDGKRPQAFAIFDDSGRMLILYTYETNISDGWSNAHQTDPEKRQKAFEMGANIVHYLINN